MGIILISVLSYSSAFAPSITRNANTVLNSVSDRRSAFESIGKALCGAAVVAGAAQLQTTEILTAGLKNPAGESWRGKYKGQQYIPGKGLRNNESFQAGLKNPAGESW